MADELPRFPLDLDAMTRSKVYVIEAGDLDSQQAIEDLIRQMWEQPEASFFYFSGHDGPPAIDPLLGEAHVRGDILMDVWERRFYHHPKYDRDYVKIKKPIDGYRFEWEERAVQEGPEFARYALQLSRRKRDDLDLWRKVQLEEHLRAQIRREENGYDVFLSYAEQDADRANEIFTKIEKIGSTVFMAKKTIEPGALFEDKIRLALLESDQLWLLATPNIKDREWVTTEWGAAWALGKLIVPIFFRCGPRDLPSRVSARQGIDFHRIDELVASLSHASK